MTLNPDLPESESMFADVAPTADAVQRPRSEIASAPTSHEFPAEIEATAQSQVWTVVAIAVSSVLGLIALVTLIWEALRPV